MSTIDDLLAQSLLLDNHQVPSDIVPHDDTASCLAYTDDGIFWDHQPNTADDGAAQSLAALCEAVVTHCTPDQLADFLTDQLPQPRAAWILGCVLQLAGINDGARFWWQYAAGADDAPASYCLYLQHLACGDTHAAALWQAQAGLPAHQDGTASPGGEAPAYRMVTADTSLPTVLRILSRLTRATPREHTETTTAVIDFVSRAVAIGYHCHPDLEIPLPGTDFAEHLEIIIAATSPARDAVSKGQTNQVLPNRQALERAADRLPAKERGQEPERLLVEVSAASESATAFFKEAVAVCWDTVSAARTAGNPDGRGPRLAYYLNRIRSRTSRTWTAQAF